MNDCVRIVAVTVESKPAEVDGNLQLIDRSCRAAARDGADVVLFPELSLSGFLPNHPTKNHEDWLRVAIRKVSRMAEPLDGDAVRGLVEISRRYDLFVSAGFVEDGDNLRYNTQVVVGPDGLVGRWRKMHIPMFEAPFFDGGDPPVVAQTDVGRIGVNICFDVLMPESTRLLAVNRAEIVLMPFAADPPPVTPKGWSDWARPAICARCVENGVFGVAVNYVGHVRLVGVEQAFPGGGVAIGPDSSCLAEWTGAAGQASTLSVDLERDLLVDARARPEYLFRCRRPELYKALSSS